MKATFIKTNTGTWAYIQKSTRINGKPTSINVKKLGTLEDIKKKEGCADPVEWVKRLALKMTEDEKAGKEVVSVEFSTYKEMEMGLQPLRHGGDLFMLPVYNRLGLESICSDIQKDRRIRYDLNEILRTLVFSRVLCPCSKIRTFEFAKGMLFPPSFKENDMYRSLSELSGHINAIQAAMYRSTRKFMDRKERVIYFDCTNYYFEIEDNDTDRIDKKTGEFIEGLRKRGKSKENRPNPIVQMGMFMDGDGIPLAFNIFPGNESEQVWLQPLEEILGREFGLTEFVVSTDAGLASEGNRRYNMAEGRDYICVQSLPKLKEEDQQTALAHEGWRISYCADRAKASALPTDDPDGDVFNLGKLLEEEAKAPGLLKDVTLYKEILVEKTFKYDNPEWLRMEKKDKGGDHKDASGKAIPKKLSVTRMERIIVTYSHDYALFLRHKRQQRLKAAEVIVRNKDEKGRHSQQSPRKYIKTTYLAKDGSVATEMEMVIDEKAIEEEARFDGFYAYGTSLEDDALLILKARSFHHEIEHLFRTSKTLLDARPVRLSRPDRIRTHFLICFIAMTVIKILQKQVNDRYPQYRSEPVSVDSLIETLRGFWFRDQMRRGYSPSYQRTELTDQLQEMSGIKVNTQIITQRKMKEAYRCVK